MLEPKFSHKRPKSNEIKGNMGTKWVRLKIIDVNSRKLLSVFDNFWVVALKALTVKPVHVFFCLNC